LSLGSRKKKELTEQLFSDPEIEFKYFGLTAVFSRQSTNLSTIRANFNLRLDSIDPFAPKKQISS
jgi:hypothetical protein